MAGRSDSRLLPSLSRATPSAVSEQFSELIGCPISKSLTTCCVCLELRSLPSPGLPRYGRRVGLHIVLFEACSAFPRVAACTLALSPIRDTLIEGLSQYVTCRTAPIASGWSGCRVGLAPAGKRRLCTAHTSCGHCRAAHCAIVGPEQGPQDIGSVAREEYYSSDCAEPDLFRWQIG